MDINSEFVSDLAGLLPRKEPSLAELGQLMPQNFFVVNMQKHLGYMEGHRFSQILEHFRSGRPLDPVYMSENPQFSEDQPGLPELDPTVSLLTDSEWTTSLFAPLEVSRGCIYDCDFCHTGLA